MRLALKLVVEKHADCAGLLQQNRHLFGDVDIRPICFYSNSPNLESVVPVLVSRISKPLPWDRNQSRINHALPIHDSAL